MEEVWNDISLSLSSIHQHPSSRPNNIHPQQHSLNFQDFLDLHKPIQNTNKNNPQLQNQLCRDDDDGGGLLFSGGAPATVLSLGNVAPVPKKRGLFVETGCNEEERSKRLMKNRESADRSRARKQAYTIELEKEVARLKKENALLKGQLKMFTSEDNAQLPKKNTLQRTLTAPF